MLLRVLHAASKRANTRSLVVDNWRAAVNHQLKCSYIMAEKKKCDVVMCGKEDKDHTEAKNYRPITCCTAMFQ